MSDLFGKRKIGPLFENMRRNPKLKREKQLLQALRRSQYVLAINSFAVVALGMFIFYKQWPVMVIDNKTKEVVGEYRQVPYRETSELIGSGQKFLNHFLSFDSKTVYNDFAIALNMMREDVKKKRIQYLEEYNVAKRIENIKTSYYIKWDKRELIYQRGALAKLEYQGNIYIQYRTKEGGTTHEEIKPFHYMLDVEMLPISPDNQDGVQINGWYEYDPII